jgi:hypothetical protein
LEVTGTTVTTPRPRRVAVALAASLLTTTADRVLLASHPRVGSRLTARDREEGCYRDAPTFIPFDPPADKYNPLGSQILTVRYGPIAHDEQVSVYTLQIRQDDGSPLNLRMTHRVQDALFGPPILGTPNREQWDRAREQRRREVDGS